MVSIPCAKTYHYGDTAAALAACRKLFGTKTIVNKSPTSLLFLVLVKNDKTECQQVHELCLFFVAVNANSREAALSTKNCSPCPSIRPRLGLVPGPASIDGTAPDKHLAACGPEPGVAGAHPSRGPALSHPPGKVQSIQISENMKPDGAA